MSQPSANDAPLVLAVPSKGRLQENATAFFGRAGLKFVKASGERGYRGTHAGHSQGGGIGLSIVRRLCTLYGWDVQVRPGEVNGVVATLRFA